QVGREAADDERNRLQIPEAAQRHHGSRVRKRERHAERLSGLPLACKLFSPPGRRLACFRDALHTKPRCQINSPPLKALRLLPRRVSLGSSFRCLALPPPSTT